VSLLKEDRDAGRETVRADQPLLPGIFDTADGARELRIRHARERDREVARRFLGSIPDDILSEVSRYWTRKWYVLNVLARCPGAMDLSRSNPALLYALASNWVFHKPAVTRPMRAARSLVNRKQRDIMEWLGFRVPSVSVCDRFSPGAGRPERWPAQIPASAAAVAW